MLPVVIQYPGDSVMAYISQGKGLMIHVDNCDEIKKNEN